MADEYSKIPFVVKEPKNEFIDVLFDDLIPKIESEFNINWYDLSRLYDVDEYSKAYKFAIDLNPSCFEDAFQNEGLLFEVSANVKSSDAIVLFLRAFSFSEDEVNEDVAASVYNLIFDIIRDEFEYTESSKNSFLSHDVECVNSSEDKDPEPEFVMPNK